MVIVANPQRSTRAKLQPRSPGRWLKRLPKGFPALVTLALAIVLVGCGDEFGEPAVDELQAPTGLTLTVGSGQVDLRWIDNSDTEEEFRIERRVGDGVFQALDKVGSNETDYSDAGVDEETRYAYRVKACNSTECSAFSNSAMATTPLFAASGLTAEAVSASEVDLTWTDQSQLETEFRIERRTATAGFSEVGATDADSTTFVDSGLAEATTYGYRVIACSAAGCAEPSNEAVATTETGSGPQAGQYLRVSSDRRWLEYGDGSMFSVNGEAAWSIMQELTGTEATVYLEDRAAKGVNLIIANLIEHKYTANTPASANAYGETPFTGTLAGGEEDFTTPNETYWSHVDWIINEADRLGIVVMALPAYVGYNHGAEGWAVEMAANGTSRHTAYGEWLGQRYADFDNIIWALGGDAPPVDGGSDLTDEINALAQGIRFGAPDHLMTAHSRRGRSSLDDYDQPWLDINASYSDDATVHVEVRTSRQAQAMPTFLIEAYYGNRTGMTDHALRAQMYQAVLGGGFGHVYGNYPTWYFGEDASHPADHFAHVSGLDWRDQLNNFGASYLPFVARLQAARNLSDLSPDYDHSYVIDGYGTEGPDYAPVLASDQVLVAYTPGRALTVDLSRFADVAFNVRWYNVRNGETTFAGSSTFGSGSETFSPPDSNDWVLLLDDQNLGLGDP